ncbi:DUF6069 family protein [Nonomuraea sp. NPDC048826]|uniref:DUF6069 family protein n=1 Tax=Nonomuraea sp. NPDC048826 TaxID=3364347 RepID=UPI00371C851E
MNTSAKRISSVVGASVAALAVWALAAPVAGTTLTVRMGAGTQAIEPGSVLVASLVVGLAGWGLLAVLERFASRPARIWTIIALAVCALSLLGPLGSAVGAAATLVLVLMHLVVGAVIVLGLARR